MKKSPEREAPLFHPPVCVVNKVDLTLEISDRTGLTREQTAEIIHLFIDSVTRALAENRKVELRNFGVFKPLLSAPRKGRNPNKPVDGVDIPARVTVKFEAGKDLREKVAALLPPPLERVAVERERRPVLNIS